MLTRPSKPIIYKLLAMGYTPGMIISLGFSKATVYKYYHTWRFLDNQVKELIKK